MLGLVVDDLPADGLALTMRGLELLVDFIVLSPSMINDVMVCPTSGGKMKAVLDTYRKKAFGPNCSFSHSVSVSCLVKKYKTLFIYYYYSQVQAHKT